MSGVLKNSEFFDELAEDYDSMIPFAVAVERKKNILKNIIIPDMKNVADLGCGTGTDSIALAQLGLNVTAFDSSERMINEAKMNAKSSGVDVKFYQHSVSEIPENFNGDFDLVISFGNTFANIDKKELNISIKKCYDLLRKEGILILQILNYHKIINERERIVNVTGTDTNLFVRFYDFKKDHIIFNLLKVNRSKLSDHSLISTNVFPHLRDDFEKSLAWMNLGTIEFYGDMQLNHFDREKSKDLIVRAVK